MKHLQMEHLGTKHLGTKLCQRLAATLPGTNAMSAALFVVVFISGCAACGGESLTVRKVLVDVEPGAATVDREVARGCVLHVLERARRVSLDEGAASGAVLRVRVENFSNGLSGGADNRLSATLSLTVEVSENGRTTMRGHGVVSAQDSADPRGLVEEALQDALGQVMQIRAADSLSSQALLQWLESPDTSEEQKRRAMRVLASRQEGRVTQHLSAALRGDNLEIALAALEALTVFGDPAATDDVIHFCESRPAVVRKRCIDTLRAVGSPRAKAWLFVLSSGHPDADVQAHAEAALVSLEASRTVSNADVGPPSAMVPPPAGATATP